MQTLTWEVARTYLDDLQPKAEKLIEKTSHWLKQYPKLNSNPESLSILLAELNRCVYELGELQPRYERLKNWTDRRWEIEKGLETIRIVRDEKKAVNFAQSAKYEKFDRENFLQSLVDASSMHLRVQNARSSARDTTEGIRSRISQIKGSMRSS